MIGWMMTSVLTCSPSKDGSMAKLTTCSCRKRKVRHPLMHPCLGFLVRSPEHHGNHDSTETVFDPALFLVLLSYPMGHLHDDVI